MKPIKHKQNPPRKVVHDIPPHNGFGSEEDSLLTVYYLRPEQSVKKVIENFKKDKHVLRFNAKLDSQSEIENDRKFVFSFFVSDNTLQIYEEAAKNSGRVSAKLQERRKVRNPVTSEYYVEKDFFVGATIYINKYIFKFYECDDKTKNYMVDNCDVFRDSDIMKILRRIQQESCKYKSFDEFLVHLLARIDPNNVGYVFANDIFSGLET